MRIYLYDRRSKTSPKSLHISITIVIYAQARAHFNILIRKSKEKPNFRGKFPQIRFILIEKKCICLTFIPDWLTEIFWKTDAAYTPEETAVENFPRQFSGNSASMQSSTLESRSMRGNCRATDTAGLSLLHWCSLRYKTASCKRPFDVALSWKGKRTGGIL